MSATTHSAEQELEDALAGFESEPEDDDESDEDEGPEATEVPEESGPDAIANTEKRLRTRMAKALDKRLARFNAGTAKFTERWEARIVAKLDEVTLKQGGQAQNVEAVKASLERQLANHEKALNALREQLAAVQAQEEAA